MRARRTDLRAAPHDVKRVIGPCDVCLFSHWVFLLSRLLEWGFSYTSSFTGPSYLVNFIGTTKDKTNRLIDLCIKIKSCNLSNDYIGKFSAEMNSGVHATYFIENANHVFEHENYVFYVLKKQELK